MLRVGLTGGIGSGKSTAARRLVARGAILIDSDVLARAVVASGTDGLAAVVAAFGERVLGADGALDRPALAAVVFGDASARSRLNAIVHPRVRERSDALVAAAPSDGIVVQDIPLLVEGGMGASFPLVAVVHAPTAERIRRLVTDRGMSRAQAGARIDAQADDAARHAVADVWLDNSGPPTALEAAVDRLWDERLVPFEANLRAHRPVPESGLAVLADPDPTWTEQAARLVARVEAAAGGLGRGVAHVGPTSVPRLPAADRIDLQLGVDSRAAADALAGPLAEAGFPMRPVAGRAGAGSWPARRHGAADPGRPVDLHVSVVGSPGWRAALLYRDWLCADDQARSDHLRAVTAVDTEAGSRRFTRSGEPFVDAARERAEAWAVSSRWVPSLP